MEQGPSDPPPERLDLGAPDPAAFHGTQSDLEQWRAGASAAFDRLWLRYRPALEVLVHGRIRSRLEPHLRVRLEAEAEDVLQEVALTAMRKCNDFEYRGTGSLLAWLGRIAENAVQNRIDYWRADRRTPARETPLHRDTDPGASASKAQLLDVAASSTGPATAVDRADRRRRLAAVLGELSEREHTIVLLRFFAGADWTEIARTVDSPSGDAVRMECFGRVLPAIARLLAMRG